MTGTDVQKLREILIFLILPEETSTESEGAAGNIPCCKYCKVVLGSAKTILWLAISIFLSIGISAL